MTAEEIRDTQFATWKDPDAWMEAMRGPKWTAVLDEEERIADSVIQTPGVQRRLGPFRVSYETTLGGRSTECEAGNGAVGILWHSDFYKEWRFRSGSKTHMSRDVCTNKTGDRVWATRDVGDGAERFSLEAWSSRSQKPLWSKTPVGPDVAILGDKVFYLSVTNKLIYHELWMCDAATGAHAECLYKEQDPQTNLSLERHPQGELFLVCDHSQEKRYYHIQVPRKGSLKLTKVADPLVAPKDWILPIVKEHTPLFVWPRMNLLVTQTHGEKSLWYCEDRKKPALLWRIPAGTLHVDPWAAWEGAVSATILVAEPARGFYTLSYTYGIGLLLESPIQPTGLVGERVSARSDDGTTVWGFLAHKATLKPKHLLVIGYGAYGIPTGVGSFKHRWAPLLEQGWAVAVTFLRGGGDHTPAWGRAGRRGGHQRTLDDFEALVEAFQTRLRIGEAHTVIYGRSAGGLLVGGMLGRDPGGTLMRGIYAEVPYVDELRTTTNPDLPLTVLEYDEFGNPAKRLEDFLNVGRLSPANTATVIKTPKVFVLARTAAHDSQVFAYESLKWIRRLRNGAPKGAPKLCLVDRNAGHFTAPDVQRQQWTVDAALLDAWVSGDL